MDEMSFEDLDLRMSALLHGWKAIDEMNVNILEHTGKPHEGAIPHSGRFPYGSGENSLQRAWDLKSRAEKFKRQGFTEVEIARALGFYQTDSKGNPIADPSTGEFKGNTKALRANLQIATETIRADNFAKIDALRSQGLGWTEIANKLGMPNESTVRSAWNRGKNKIVNKTEAVADKLKEAVDQYDYIDVGSGVNISLGVSANALDTALARLEAEGYVVQNIYVPQLSNPIQKTTLRVLAKPGDTDVYANRFKVHTLDIDANGNIKPKESVAQQPLTMLDSKRIKIRYDEDGGKEQDGLIEIRAIRNKDGSLSPANPDLSLGNAKYAQIRIAVDGKYYIKGMARYNPDLDTDIVVNSNKSRSKGIEGALKPLGDSEDNPFGTSFIPTEYVGSDGKTHRSPINIVGSKTDIHAEGGYERWSRNLPSQFLSKQSEELVRQQLNLTKDAKRGELDKIQRLTNPVVKRQMLIDYADQMDRAAADLKAIKLPGQMQHVLLPVKSLKDNEIYAPNYPSGTQLALVRYPHAGPFEIPVLTVNNKNKEANTVMKNAKDAVGINAHNASILSGADFDGDTATVIPISKVSSTGVTRTVKLKTHKDVQIPGLQDFDPTAAYGPDNYDKPYKIMTKKAVGKEMGVVSNLITDMYAKGCDDPDEIERADKYSMVVIDSPKHKLNYIQAKKDFNIEELQRKYQQNPDNKKGYGGASSLLSRSKSEARVPLRALRDPERDIDPVTGEKIYRRSNRAEYSSAPKIKAKDPGTGRLIRDTNGKAIYETAQGKYVKGDDGKYSYDPGSNPGKGQNRYIYDESKAVMKVRQESSTKMAETKDARTLLSENALPIERMYADYANTCKALANQARLESLAVPRQKYNPEAAKTYSKEVKSLNEKYQKALANAPRERQAQLIATSKFHALDDANPQWTDEDRKKQKGIALNDAREKVGAHKDRVTFTEKEWEAVQHNAIPEGKLKDLLKQADKTSYVKLATPKDDIKISNSMKNVVLALYKSDVYTNAELAEHLGISVSTIQKIVNES